MRWSWNRGAVVIPLVFSSSRVPCIPAGIPHGKNQRGEHGGQREWSLPAHPSWFPDRPSTILSPCSTVRRQHPRLHFSNAADDSIEVPGACSAVPHSPVSGNVSSTRGLPLAGPGIRSTPFLGGMSLKISFISSGSRCPVACAATSPSSTLQTVLLCILAVHIPLRLVVSWGSRRYSGRCLSASLQLP